MRLTSDKIFDVARALNESRNKAHRIESSSTGVVLDNLDDVYEIQKAVCGIESTISAWKVGMDDSLNLPIVAPILPSKLFQNGSTIKLRDFNEVGLEAELAYVFSEPLTPKEENYSEREIRAAISGICITIEILDSRLVNWRNESIYWKLADNQLNGALVVKNIDTNWEAIDYSAQSVTLSIDGNVVISDMGSHTTVDPFKTVVATANEVIKRYGSIKKGDVITAGSWTVPYFVNYACLVEVDFQGIGNATVRIE